MKTEAEVIKERQQSDPLYVCPCKILGLSDKALTVCPTCGDPVEQGGVK